MQSQDLSSFKTTIIFTNTKLASDLQDYLILKYPGIPVHKRPWKVNHSRGEEIDKDDIVTRTANDSSDPIKLIITTSCMLMGINVPSAHIVINLGLMGNFTVCVQALGRIGRRVGDNEKTRPVGLMYNVLNATDMAQHHTQGIKDFMVSSRCLTAQLEEHFGWSKTKPVQSKCFRCSNCF